MLQVRGRCGSACFMGLREVIIQDHVYANGNDGLVVKGCVFCKLKEGCDFRDVDPYVLRSLDQGK